MGYIKSESVHKINSVYFLFSFYCNGTGIKMKCNQFVTILVVLFMCLHLNGVHCSNKGKTDSDTDALGTQKILNLESVHWSDNESSKPRNPLHACIEGNCNDDKANGRPKSDSLKRIDELNIFQEVDPNFKGHYLMKTDVSAFMAIMGKKREIKISELEINLFHYTADTDKDGKISTIEYKIIMTKPSSIVPSSFMNLRSEAVGDNSLERDCIYEEDLELLSENAEYDFLLLDTNKDECFSFKEFKDFFARYGSVDLAEDSINGETSDVSSDKNDKIIKNIEKLHLNKPSTTVKENNLEDELHEETILVKSESEEIQKRDIFEGFDRTIAGYLLKRDLPHYMRHKALLTEDLMIFELEINLFLYTIDTDKNNKISEDEFLSIMTNPIGIVTSTFINLRSESHSLDMDCIYEEDLELLSETAESEFPILDRDNDDCLSFKEFKEFFSTFGIEFPNDGNSEGKNTPLNLYEPSTPLKSSQLSKSKETFEEHGSQSKKLATLLNQVDDEVTDDKDIFHGFDRTLKGYLTKKDVPSFMVHNGKFNEIYKVSELEIDLFLHTLDADKNGKISAMEYQQVYDNNQWFSRSYFYYLLNEDIHDEIYSKYIGKLKSFCIYKSHLKILADDIQLELDFEQLDTDKDGCFTYEEFEDFFVRYGMTSYLQNVLRFSQEHNNYGKDDYEKFFYSRTPLNDPDLKVSGSDATKLITLANIFKDKILQDFDINFDGYIDISEQKDDLTATIFSELDLNSDKKISSEELTDAATEELLYILQLAKERLEGLKNQYLSDYLLSTSSRVFEIFDSDKNGQINTGELQFLMEVHRKFITSQIVMSKLAQYDFNVDHRISLAEFSHTIRDTIELEGAPEEDEYGNYIEGDSLIHNSSHLIEIVFNQMDENVDGFVNEEEYLNFLRHLYSDAQLKNFFDIADVDNDGFVPGKILHILLTDVVKPYVKEEDVVNLETFKKVYHATIMSIVPEGQAENIFAVVDTDSDSVLSVTEFQVLEDFYEIDDKSEFVIWLEKYLQRNSLEKQAYADFTDSFSLFDNDRNGYITKEELKDALNILLDAPHTPEDMDKWFLRLDMNEDNVISMTEFDLLLMK